MIVQEITGNRMAPGLEESLKADRELAKRISQSSIIPESTIQVHNPCFQTGIRDIFQKDTSSYYDHVATEKRDPLKKVNPLQERYNEGSVLCFMAINNGRNRYSLVQMPIHGDSVPTDCVQQVSETKPNATFREGEALYATKFLVNRLDDIIGNIRKEELKKQLYISHKDMKLIKLTQNDGFYKESESSVRDYNVFVTVSTMNDKHKSIVKKILETHFNVDPSTSIEHQMIAFENLNSLSSDKMIRGWGI